MIVKTKKGNEFPPGSIELTENEALKHQIKFIKNWPYEKDVFFLKYGKHINSASTLLSSGIIYTFFFRKLNLTGSPHILFALLPTVAIPTFTSYLMTDRFLTNKVLLMKMDCPLCNQLKFSIYQLYISIGFPTIYGYCSLSSLAYKTMSYNLPNIMTHAKEFWQETFKICKNGARTFQFVGLIQCLWIMILPYIQNKQLFYVMNKAEKESYVDQLDNFVF